MFANPYDDFTDITNEIDSKIVELLNLKQEIEHTIYLLKAFNAIPISKTAFNKLCDDEKIDKEAVYYIVKPEVGKYIKGYIDIGSITN